jgi:hypothetical protein
LLKEFRDVVIEARKVFDLFNMLGRCYWYTWKDRQNQI